MFGKTSKLTFFTNELETPHNSLQRLKKLVFPPEALQVALPDAFSFLK